MQTLNLESRYLFGSVDLGDGRFGEIMRLVWLDKLDKCNYRIFSQMHWC